MSGLNGPRMSSAVMTYSRIGGSSVTSISRAQVSRSSSPLGSSSFCNWNARSALARLPLTRPSIAPMEKPDRSSITCALSTTARNPASSGVMRLASLMSRAVSSWPRAGAVSTAATIALIIAARCIIRQRQESPRARARMKHEVSDSLKSDRDLWNASPGVEGSRHGNVPRDLETDMHELSEEQRLMRQSCRSFVDDVVIPFIRQNWQREWTMVPEDRLPPDILKGADQIGIRTLG